MKSIIDCKTRHVTRKQEFFNSSILLTAKRDSAELDGLLLTAKQNANHVRRTNGAFIIMEVPQGLTVLVFEVIH